MKPVRSFAWLFWGGALLVSCALSPHMTADLRGRDCTAFQESSTTVLWTMPRNAADRRTLDRWCRAVGPMVYGPEPAVAVRADADSIVLVTWNANVGAGDVLGFLEHEVGLQCGAKPAAGTHAILLLQEALRRDESVPPDGPDDEHQQTVSERDSDRERVDIVSVARRCGLALLYVPSVRNGDNAHGDGREDLGNAVLATLPLESPFAMELPRTATRRVAVGATVQLPEGERIRVVSLHFNTFPGPWKLLRTGNSSRVRQALALGEGLVIVEGQEDERALPTVAGGDLNTWSTNEGAFRQMLRLFPGSPDWHGAPTRGAFPTDHLFFRQGDRASTLPVPRHYRRIDADYNSDHHPVMAWLYVSRR